MNQTLNRNIAMKIQMVPRSKVARRRRLSSKYAKLYDALEGLKPEGPAIQLGFTSSKQLIGYRNVLYNYNRKNGIQIRSSVDKHEKKIFMYLGK